MSNITKKRVVIETGTSGGGGLTSVSTTDSASVTWSGNGTSGSPLVATAADSSAPTGDNNTVAYFDNTGALSDNTDFTWDNTLKELIVSSSIVNGEYDFTVTDGSLNLWNRAGGDISYFEVDPANGIFHFDTLDRSGTLGQIQFNTPTSASPFFEINQNNSSGTTAFSYNADLSEIINVQFGLTNATDTSSATFDLSGATNAETFTIKTDDIVFSQLKDAFTITNLAATQGIFYTGPTATAPTVYSGLAFDFSAGQSIYTLGANSQGGDTKVRVDDINGIVFIGANSVGLTQNLSYLTGGTREFSVNFSNAPSDVAFSFDGTFGAGDGSFSVDFSGMLGFADIVLTTAGGSLELDSDGDIIISDHAGATIIIQAGAIQLKHNSGILITMDTGVATLTNSSDNIVFDWESALLNNSSGTNFWNFSTAAPQSGWGNYTGAEDKSDFDPSLILLPALAQHVGALQKAVFGLNLVTA